jgi:hypothetical protein
MGVDLHDQVMDKDLEVAQHGPDLQKAGSPLKIRRWR